MTRASASGLVLGFDFGLKHIGVAVGQRVTRTATPLPALKARNGAPDWNALDALVAEWGPDSFVVGLPLNMDDTDGPMTPRARAFARSLEGRYGLRATLVDERLTTREAMRENPDLAASHGIAARLIVESHLGEN